MGKPIVIIADLDESYLLTLELKFLQELKDKIELEVITDREYFDAYFQNPRKAELLVVGEELYSQELLRHTVGSLFVLSEYFEEPETEELSVHRVYKYTSIKEIFNELVSDGLSNVLEDKKTKKDTQVIAVYSPIGGVGVTTLAVGLSAALAKNHKKVFFLSTEVLQNFQFYLNNPGYLPNEACVAMKNGERKLYEELKIYIRNEGFYYLPPLYASPSAMGLQTGFYRKLIEEICITKDYDYVVVDMETGFVEEKTALFSVVDKIMVIMMQDAFSVKKMENLTRSMELKNSEKFLFVCNRFLNEKMNCFVGSKLQSQIGINEYIGVLPLEEIDNILQLEQFGEFQQLAYMFI